MQTFSPLQSLFPPRRCSAPSTEHPQRRPVRPRALSLPLPSPPAGHMEPISLVTLKSRPCARLPFRHGAPGAPAPRRAPPSVAAPLPGHRAAAQSPEPSALPARPARGGGPPAPPERGASRAAPRPAASKAEQSRGRGGAGCGPRFRASPRGRPPARPPQSPGRPGRNDRDAAGRAPAGAEGPEPGPGLPRAPRTRTRRPGAACALAGAHR